jgi:ATP-dependent exoDNAse (exonuclease V) alpha subunit
MAWALTIHKSQGLTLHKATIDIGNTDRQGLTFTAISRVRELADLCIQPSFTFERYACMQHNPFVARRKEEEARLLTLSNSTPQHIPA